MGSVVRLHLRSTVEACGNDAQRWLIYFEDHGSREAHLEEVRRLKAEMLGVIDSIDSGVLLLDAAGNIRVVSEPLCPNRGAGSAQCFGIRYDRTR